MNNNHTQAKVAYRDRYEIILAELERIKSQLSAHRDEFVGLTDSKDWGYVGDLGRYAEILKDIKPLV